MEGILVLVLDQKQPSLQKS